MEEVLEQMKLSYPAYLWTHNGWVQQMDAKYDAGRWSRERPLVVHVVPFSHNDPGQIPLHDSLRP